MKCRILVPVVAFLAMTSVRVCAQERIQSSTGRVSLPGKNWGVVLDLPGFAIETNETKPDGRPYMLANNQATGVILSVTLEEVPQGNRASGCKESLEGKAKDPRFRKKDTKITESASMTFLEYLVPEVGGIPVQQKNLFVCLFRENVYIDLHFSKVRFQPGEEKLFTAVLDTLRFQENVERTSLDYMQIGSVYYLQRDYRKAIPAYAQALALEKQSRQLEKKLWYVLVDNLGMAYGITGDLKSAKETFEYGLSKDATYPLFYYNLACTHAEMNDLEKAMAYLKKAFEYKQNVIPGEKMPDPKKDDSFQRFLKNEEFRKLLDSLGSASR
jgi:tetratricopeptide (TPR) repeat protein